MTGLLFAMVLGASAQDSNIVENLGGALPLATVWQDANGQTVRLGDHLLQSKPTLLVLQYFRCPMLCSMVMDGVIKSLRTLKQRPDKDYALLTLSFDPDDTPAVAHERQNAAVQRLGLEQRAWPFLTGNHASIDAVLSGLGVTLWRDPQSGEYAHPAAAFVIAPNGTVAHYLYGIRFDTEALEGALDKARDNRITTTMERIFLRCFAYHPAARRFAPLLTHVTRYFGIAMLAGMGCWMGFLVRSKARSQR